MEGEKERQRDFDLIFSDMKKNKVPPKVVLGIDPGRTFSCVAVWKDDGVVIIPNEQGNRTTPSLIAFRGNEVLIGDPAKDEAIINAKNTVFDVKLLIGKRFNDHDISLLPFEVIADQQDKPVIVVKYRDEKKRFSPEEIFCLLLHKMRDMAESYLGFSVKNVVITVPYQFGDSEREATKNAGVLAGVNVIHILNEPAAAAIAYGLDRKATGVGLNTVIVFDLGGRALNVSLVAIGADGTVEVKDAARNSQLGGSAFDTRMIRHCANEFKRKHEESLLAIGGAEQARVLGRLRQHCERAKCSLSYDTEVSIQIDGLYHRINFQCTITRADFEGMNVDLFRGCIDLVNGLLKGSRIRKKSVDEVVLVGGSCKIPKIQELVQDFFRGKDLCKSINTDEVIAYGAAMKGALLNGTKKVAEIFQGKNDAPAPAPAPAPVPVPVPAPAPVAAPAHDTD